MAKVELRIYAGQHDLAIKHVETALRLSPRSRMGQPLNVIAKLISSGVNSTKLLLAIQDNPRSPLPYRHLAACYAHMGRLDDAHAIVVRLRVITPVVVPSELPYRNAEDRELFLSGLRLAMGEAE